ncbi:major intrinsic protein superfamily membrane channel protein [Armillaria luteobubalina]|uniref:Major intrinsic protein superfamily membrane channel protein n=1 Tax=Armillaria luteobubalina TaxID=153913 RepID=A0AA39P1N3_9AGAR|nr:major intrinsic protein superfamily membrane channel protein [Armillaria luteobubalina]
MALLMPSVKTPRILTNNLRSVSTSELSKGRYIASTPIIIRLGLTSTATIHANSRKTSVGPTSVDYGTDKSSGSPAAEFAGTMLLVIFGTGVNCQAGLSANSGWRPLPKATGRQYAWAGGLVSIALGAWVSGGVSGGHINPAITLAFATWRGFPWKKVPVYILSQLLGGIVGAGIVYANYFHAIDIVEGGRGVRTLLTAGNFGTIPLDYMTNVSCFFSEFLGTAILVLVLLAVLDSRNGAPPSGLVPLVLFVTFLGITASLGMETSFAINPARDLGPRLLTSMVGYGKAVYTFRNHYWIWCPIIAPILGAQVAAMFYDVFIYQGHESIVNRRIGRTGRHSGNMV